MKIIELKEMMNHQLKMSQKNMKREQLFINNLEHIIEYSYVEKYIQKIKNKNKDLVEKCSLDFLDDIRKFIKYNIQNIYQVKYPDNERYKEIQIYSS